MTKRPVIIGKALPGVKTAAADPPDLARLGR